MRLKSGGVEGHHVPLWPHRVLVRSRKRLLAHGCNGAHRLPDDENSFLDFGLGIFGLLGLMVCLIRKSDGASINFVALGTGLVVSTLVAVMTTCAVVAFTSITGL